MNLVIHACYSLIVLLTVFQQCLPANILAVTTMFTSSHYIWHKVLLKELAQRGHNITVLSHQRDNEDIANYTLITMEGMDYFEKHLPMKEFVISGPVKSILLLWHLEELSCELDIKSSGLQTLLNYPKDYKFDLVLWDLNRGRCLYPLIDRFGSPPVIATSPFGHPPNINYVFGGITLSHVPFYQVKTVKRIDILTRLETFLCNYVNILTREYYANPREFKISRDFFGDNIRSIAEVERNMSLVLSNIDPVFNDIGQLPLNVIPVGGMHASRTKKLPQDLQTLLDDAKNGVIVVGFGSVVNWLNFGPQQKEAFIELFKKLNQTILFKSPEIGFELPKNVFVRKWLPQNDVLAHPNVKLLITHGGALTIQEAVIHKVPLIGIPNYLDQHGNLDRIHTLKLGKSIDYRDLTPHLLYSEVSEVLNNPLYYKNVQKFSKLYKNQPQSALEKAVFWTEFILEYGSADHLNPTARHYNFIQKHDLDLVAIILMTFCLLAFSVYTLYQKLKMFLKLNITIIKKRQ